MKRIIFIFAVSLMALTGASAQEASGPFRAYLFNKEYQLFIRLDLYGETITIPGQDLYGELPGYIGRKQNSYCWVVTSAEVKANKARLTLINDYGSEDFTATLTQHNDTLYTLQYEDGSTFKMPLNGKWQKLPKKLDFIRSAY